MSELSQGIANGAGSPGSSERAGSTIVRVGWFQRAFVAVFLLVILIDGAPRAGAPHRWLAAQLRPFLEPLGIHQPKWFLFAPEPQSWNEHLTAELQLSDGRTVHWRSPQWKRLSRWERFRRSRQINYYGAILSDAREGESHALWAAFADYLARRQEADGPAKVRRVELTCHWVNFAPPEEDWRPFGQAIAPQHARMFFGKDYP